MAVVLRTDVPPQSLSEAVRAQVRALNPDLPVVRLETLEEVVSSSISQPRFYTTLLGGFAAVALVLASVGLFGVLSHAVSQRTREIGIRMALGAERRALIGLIVRQALLLAGIGVALGLGASLLLSRTLTSLLFGLSPTDASTFAAVALVLVAVALVASYAPARRASRVDPVVALRAE
jgi:ABC-type antimicrobial peptide transport system permease subunit